jgi:hypothetical protein
MQLLVRLSDVLFKFILPFKCPHTSFLSTSVSRSGDMKGLNVTLQISETSKGAAGWATAPFTPQIALWLNHEFPKMLCISKESMTRQQVTLLGNGAPDSVAN